MKSIQIALTGFGYVSRAFFTLLKDKSSEIQKKYGLKFELKLIVKSDGCFKSPYGSLEIRHVSKNGQTWTDGNPFWKKELNLADALNDLGQDGCLVECTPSNYETGQPALDYIKTAFDSNWNVVAASKGALVVGFKEIRETAREKNLNFGFSGATAAALPTLDVGMISLAGTRIESIQGILNGTTNYILTRMSEGLSYAEALKEAQNRGIAEPDPAFDVEGRDAAVKILIITNAIFGTDYCLSDVQVQGISGLDTNYVCEVKAEGKAVKLLATAAPARTGGGWKLGVKPSIIDSSHPLYHVNGTEKGITFLTDSMGLITVTGGRSTPRGTAAALLKDMINIYRNRLTGMAY